ncbi:MAG TPA: phosphoenolpyruvate carboxykinase domain-containing protein, partial [Anaeromyxobacteraceae bacterium]|nr:phosphoenolpyruvate carboxykinase domain-containing protein [Anaeromyxobacteraceae bacterium]
LVLESFNWTHGTYLAATMGSETTAAASGQLGVVRRDPMAMLPFLGYDAGSYLQHWLDMQLRIPRPPRIFLVNWFRRSGDGRFLWPGYGENMRVLKWIIDRCHGRIGAQETLLGWLPQAGDLDLRGLDAPREAVEHATRIDLGEWEFELESQKEWFDKLGRTLPPQLELLRQGLLAAVKNARAVERGKR